MAFSPVSLPIQEILLTNFVTDIATISNANDLVLQDTVQDLINNLEIDTNTLSIGTDNAIGYIRTSSVIMEETGFTFQTGLPATIIAKLEKNISSESVLTVDNLVANVSASIASITTDSSTTTTSLTANGATTLNGAFQFNAASIESKETVSLPLIKNGTLGEARLTLTNTSRKNIFVTLNAVTAPSLNYVYDGSILEPTLTAIRLYIDFDATNPPAQNTIFTIYLVDITNAVGSTSILSVIDRPVLIRGGVNNSVVGLPAIILHDGSSTEVGIPSNGVTKYGQSISLLYIIDDNTDDHLVINGLVGMEFI